MNHKSGIKRPRTDPLQQVPPGDCIGPPGAHGQHVDQDSSCKPTPSTKATAEAPTQAHMPQIQSRLQQDTALPTPASAMATTRHPKQQQTALAAMPADAGRLHSAQAAAAAAAATVAAADRPVMHGPSRRDPLQLSSLCVFLHGSIPMLQRRLPIISKRLQQLGIALAPPNTLNNLNTNKRGIGSSSSRGSSKLKAFSIKPSSGNADGSSSNSKGSYTAAFKPTQITHIVLHAPSDGSSSSSSGGSSFRQAAVSPKEAAAAAAGSSPAGLHQLLKQAQQLRQQQQQQGGKDHHSKAGLCCLVSDGWLDAVLAAGLYVSEQQYSLDHLITLPAQQQGDGGGSSSSDDGSDQQRAVKRPRFMPDLDPAADAPMGRFAMWLGRWEPRFNSINTQVEFVLQAKYSVSESSVRGPNETVRAALKELADYEEAIGGSKGDPGVSNLNHEALTYAHAAAVVRGCAFPLSPSLAPAQLQRLLPFVGAFVAKIIHQLLTTGTCEQLQCYRQNLPVTNSRAELRPNTAGGATRALFTKLPGVGPIMAEKWFKAGFRSIESLLEAAAAAEQAAASAASMAPSAASNLAAGDSSSSRYGQYSIFPLGRAAMYSLQHSSDMLEVMDPNDITEMKQEVLRTLTTVTPGVTDGWVMQQVGGAIRGGAVHDADWLITNNKCDPQLLEGLVVRVYNHMVKCGRLVPQEEGFCRIQVGKLEGYKDKARKDLLEKTDRGNRHQLDHYDHIWGVYLTHAGKRRRMDLIFVPPDCHSWVFAFIGWSGSKQYLRFMRTHAGNCGMFLNSHFMMREVLLKTPTVHQTASAAAMNAPGSRLQQQQTVSKDAADIQRQDVQHPPLPAAAAAADTCNGCRPSRVDLRPALRYVAAAAAAGSFKSVVLSVPDEAPPADSSGKEWWPPGWGPDADAAAAASAAANAGSTSIDADSLAADRDCLSEHVLAGAGSDRPVTQERDLFELLGIPYRSPHERCC